MISLENEIQTELNSHCVAFIYFVDISQLSPAQNKGYPNAILIGLALSPGYLQEIADTPDYVQKMIAANKGFEHDEFFLKELKADNLADHLADYLNRKGFSAYSQSEKNLYSTNVFDEKRKSTPLPHKTIAILAGLGRIGKHNLLITPSFGSAICLGSVLTDAPLKSRRHTPSSSTCGDCRMCEKNCETQAIWKKRLNRPLINGGNRPPKVTPSKRSKVVVREWV